MMIENKNIPCLIFAINNALFMIPEKDISYVQLFPDNITELSDQPDHILGICDLNGKIITVIELNKLLNLNSASEQNNGNCKRLLVLSDKKGIGLLVDEIVATETIGNMQRKEKNRFVSEWVKDFFLYNNKNIIMELNISKLLATI